MTGTKYKQRDSSRYHNGPTVTFFGISEEGQYFWPWQSGKALEAAHSGVLLTEQRTAVYR